MARAGSYLVADIGGTNARFAIARGSARAGFRLDEMQRFKNEDFETLRDAAFAFLQSCSGDKPTAGCFAVAGPIADGVVRLTNSNWRFHPDELAEELGLQRLAAVNDFAAQARGALLCAPEDQVELAAGDPVEGAPCAVLGPGTGLGLGLLVPEGERVHVVATEGGHAGFAPRTDVELEVGKFIADEYGFCSWERLLSGRGLVNIHRALCHIEDVTWGGYRPEKITERALEDETSISRRTVDLFCNVLGGYAGDVAVITGARGGIYLGGGILPKILPILRESAFHPRFTRRGPMSKYAESIPVRLVQSDAPALMGAAAIAEEGGL
jgi:glucokinase